MAERPWIDVAVVARPKPAAAAAFAAAGASVAANLLPHAGGLHSSLTRICGSGAVAGPALTAHAPRGDNLAAFVALRDAVPGDVLVLATDEGPHCAVVGDRIAQMAANAGIVAIVTDGLVRDIAGLERIGLPVYARGRSPNAPARRGPVEVGHPVAIGGLVVRGGDLVVADDDGIAVLAQSDLDRALAELPAALAAEAAADAAAAAARYPAWLDALIAELAPRERACSGA